MEDEGEHVVAVAAMMTVLIVLFAIGTAECGEVMTGVPAIVMVVIVDVRAHGVHRHVPMQAGRRCPGELERNDEHDDQGDEAAHERHCSVPDVFTKRPGLIMMVRQGGHSVPAGPSRSFEAGKAITKRVLWSSEDTLIVPPCASTMDLQMASPSPVPSALRCRDGSTR